MLRTINVTFEDKEFQTLEKRKAERSWHDFLLDLVKTGNAA